MDVVGFKRDVSLQTTTAVAAETHTHTHTLTHTHTHTLTRDHPYQDMSPYWARRFSTVPIGFNIGTL